MNLLLRQEEIVVGYVDHVIEKLGHVVIKFPKDKAPRLKVQKSVMAIKNIAKVELGCNVMGWNCSFLDFCKESRYHSKPSDLVPLYYLKKSDTAYDYVGCTGISIELFDLFKETSLAGKSLSVIVFNPFPPVDYFNNLANFLEVYHDMPEQLISSGLDFEDWHPEELEYNPQKATAIPDRIVKTLNEENCCILQGPPGTGKSYTIAYIVSQYLKEGKTVCVTTMANKGLIELVKQEPLLPFLEAGRISKSNLSADEKRTVQGLKPIKKGFVVPKGELFCSTNYVLSQVYNSDNLVDDSLPSYDLIIIEEASQAFLASIIAFKKLGEKCLIVGDPMQLPPIISNPNKALYKAWNIRTQIEGLKTYALGTKVKSFRITTTFRLTEASAKLTGIFYDNRFRSVQQVKVIFDRCHSCLFPQGGGVLYHNTEDYTNGIISGSALRIIAHVVELMSKNYPNRSLSVISPFNETVKQLQKNFLNDKNLDDITIETIDRIQGMTVDYAILYIPGRNPGFALDERRFNVATSRSRSTTLIITDIPPTEMHSISPKVATFIKHCTPLTQSEIYNHTEDNEIQAPIDDDVTLLYPGLEDVVKKLLENGIPFSREGDVELLDEENYVIASAGMLLKDYKIAIDPIDNSSKEKFEEYGYTVVAAQDFDISMLNHKH
jgi:hypothetical protein